MLLERMQMQFGVNQCLIPGGGCDSDILIETAAEMIIDLSCYFSCAGPAFPVEAVIMTRNLLKNPSGEG